MPHSSFIFLMILSFFLLFLFCFSSVFTFYHFLISTRGLVYQLIFHSIFLHLYFWAFSHSYCFIHTCFLQSLFQYSPAFSHLYFSTTIFCAFSHLQFFTDICFIIVLFSLFTCAFSHVILSPLYFLVFFTPIFLMLFHTYIFIDI